MILLVVLVCVEALTKVKVNPGQNVTLNCSGEKSETYWYTEIHSQVRLCIGCSFTNDPSQSQYYVQTFRPKYSIFGKSLLITNITTEDCRLYFCGRRLNDNIQFVDTFSLISDVAVTPSTNNSGQNGGSIWRTDLIKYISFELNAFLILMISLLCLALCLEKTKPSSHLKMEVEGMMFNVVSGYVPQGAERGAVVLYEESGVADKYVRVVQDMYESCKTVVRCAVGVTEEFKVEVGLHQRSGLSPFLFALVIDRLTDKSNGERGKEGGCCIVNHNETKPTIGPGTGGEVGLTRAGEQVKTIESGDDECIEVTYLEGDIYGCHGETAELVVGDGHIRRGSELKKCSSTINLYQCLALLICCEKMFTISMEPACTSGRLARVHSLRCSGDIRDRS
ncbi:hypothetical protein Q8A73_004989 [Channa argus]|nr:hypothetical protein Q8A73_004989 [Channa argus]